MENNWPVLQLEKIATVIDSRHKTPQYSEFGYPMVRVVDIKGGELSLADAKNVTSDVYADFSKGRDPEIGDLIISRVGSYGNVSYVFSKQKFCLGQNTALIIPKDNDRFLYYALISPQLRKQIDNMAVGAVQKTISLKSIKGLEVPQPPAQERSRIANSLSSLDDKITLNRQINKTLEQMAQALFKSWFVDFDPVVDNALDAGFFAQNLDLPDELLRRAEARQAVRNRPDFKPLPDATRQLFPAAFEECAEPSLGLAGWVPKGWSVKRLDEILELVYGKALKKTDRISGNYPVYGSGGVDGTHISSLVDGPGIIVGRKGTVGSIYWESNNFFPIDTVFYVKPKESYSLEYCHELLKTLGLEKMNTDAAVPGLNRNNAYRLLCVTPCNIISDALSKVFSSYRHRIELCEKESLALTKLRNTLLPKLISGELRLDNIKAELVTDAVN